MNKHTRFLTRVLVNWGGIYLAGYLFPAHIQVASPWEALLAGAVLAVVNLIVRPLVVVVSLPANILTLGLFTVVINALMLELTDLFVPGLKLYGFWWAALASLIVSVGGFLVRWLLGDDK
jgi:putative membrane protein